MVNKRQKDKRQEKQKALQMLNLEQVLNRQPLKVHPDTEVASVVERMGIADGSLKEAVKESADRSSRQNDRSYDHNDRNHIGRFSCALVVLEGKVVGIFTERDLVRLVAEDVDIGNMPISAVMAQPVLALQYSAVRDIFTVLSYLKQNRIRQVPLIEDDGSLVGIASQTSIRRAMQPFNFLKVRHVEDAMTKAVITGRISESLTVLAQRMHRHRVSCVVIVEDKRRSSQVLNVPIGIVTERDIVQYQAIGLPLARTIAKDAMSAPLFLASPQDTLWTANQIMEKHHTRRLVVADSTGELVGIVTQTSLLEPLDPLQMIEEIEQLQTLSENQASRLSDANLQLQASNQTLRIEVEERKRLESALQRANQLLEEQLGIQAAQLVQTNETLLLEVQERQQAQRELEQFFSVTPTMLCIAGLNGYFKRLNPAFFQVLGYRNEELMTQPFINFVHPEDRESTIAEMENLASGGKTIAFENRYRCKDGSYRWLNWNSMASVEESVIYASAHDITQQRQTELNLKRQYQQGQLISNITRKIRESLEPKEILRTAVTEVQAILGCDRVFIIERDSNNTGQVIEESKRPDIQLSLLGQPVLELELTKVLDTKALDTENLNTRASNAKTSNNKISKTTVPEVCASEDLSQDTPTLCARQFLNQFHIQASLEVSIYVRSQPWGLLVAGQNKKGREWQPFEIELMEQLANQVGVAIAQSQLLDNLESVVEQRTAELSQTNERLQLEIQERTNTERALRNSQEQLRLTTDALPVLICYVDAEQRYRFSNKTYAEWFNRSVEEIEGQLIKEVIGDRYYQQAQVYIEQALTGERVDYEMTVPIADNQVRDLAVTYVPDIDDENQVKGFFGLISDISDRKANERIKDEFISMVSHELRTPLTSIHGSMKLLSMKLLGDLTPKGEELVDIALQNTDRLSRLINDVLDLERIESGRVSMIKEDCHLEELMTQAANAMRPMASELSVNLAVRSIDETLSVDPDRIVQTLTNLLSNAIKFSPTNSEIVLGAERRERDVLLYVQDCGPGIPIDKLELVFERFQQVNPRESRRLGGTGLGLAICKQIVQQHSGNIWVESVLGKGSKFCFTLPK